MKKILLLLTMLWATSCNIKADRPSQSLEGTWKLLSGTLIEKGDTTTTVYADSLRMIKIINNTHFSFLNHDTNKGQDSAAVFVAGGGRYELAGDNYTEHLEYCSDRQWEGHDFTFKVVVQNDTLIQTGKEVIEKLGVNRLNIERYVRVK